LLRIDVQNQGNSLVNKLPLQRLAKRLSQMIKYEEEARTRQALKRCTNLFMGLLELYDNIPRSAVRLGRGKEVLSWHQ
jgi:hypothetical protein